MANIHDLTYMLENKISDAITEYSRTHKKQIDTLLKVKYAEKGCANLFIKAQELSKKKARLNEELAILKRAEENVLAELRVVYDQFYPEDYLLKEVMSSIPEVKQLQDLKNSIREKLLVASLSKNIQETMREISEQIKTLTM